MSSFHSLKERLETVLKVKSGVPIVQLCKDLHTGRDQILEWVRRYDEQGEAGLVRHKTYRQISCAEKEHLVRLYLEKTYLCARFTPPQTSVALILRHGYV